MVVLESLNKSSYFILVKSAYSAEDYARILIDENVGLHGISLSIILDWGEQFTSRFQRSFQKEFVTKLKLSTTFHPQMDGQVERTIQTLEDILRASVIYFKGNWDKHLLLIEFSYKKSYHSSISMAPYEPLYGRICRYLIGLF